VRRSGLLWLLLLAPLVLPGCVRRPTGPGAGVHYVVGGGYQAGGAWYYPREDFHYLATGLASVLPVERGRTADGETMDAAALTAAHQTLQLPAIVRVTNLDTGLQTLVRVNDRGPASPARLIALSRRAALLLGVPDGGTAPVRVEIEEAMSLALRDRLQGGPVLTVATAPRDTVRAETLAPPPGIGQSVRGRSAGATQTATDGRAAVSDAVPDRLPEEVQRVFTSPVQMMIQAGTFGRMSYARDVQDKLNGLGSQVQRVREGRSEAYRVVAGPFPTVAAADAALDQARRAGVSDARIVLE
jgi:rare lipoprotein A